MYKIKYYYQTGHSLHTYDDEDVLDLEFKTLNLAQENLQRIKEHYGQYKKVNSYRCNDAEDVYRENEDKDWFVKSDGSYDSKHCIKLKLDNGKFIQFWAPWCGYFETLYSAEIIVPLEENKNRIEF